MSLCRLLRAPAGQRSFPALSPQSLCRCLDPYPVTPLQCACSLLPAGQRPHLRRDRFGVHKNNRCNATSTANASRGCSHSITFRLPHLLDPQVVPTAGNTSRAAGPFTPRNGLGVTPKNRGIATCLNRAIGTTGLSPARLRPCRPLPRSPRAELPHGAPRSYSLRTWRHVG